MDVGFFDANLIRAFPFVANIKKAIPDWLIVDFRAEMLSGGWNPAIHRVYLAWVTKLDTRLRFGFRTDSPNLADEELIFERDLSDPRFTTTFANSTALADTLEERCGCSQELLCNTTFGTPAICEERACNPDFSPACGPEHVCNPRLSLIGP